MKKLNQEQTKQKLRLDKALAKAGQDLTQSVERFNELIEQGWASVQAAQDAYLGVLQEAEAFRETIQDLQENYQEDRGEAWQVSDAGTEFAEWADEWSEPLDDDVDLESPEIIELPDMTTVATFLELPTSH